MDLEDKVALVTGGAQGLGKGFAEILLVNQAKVCIVDLNEEVGKTTCDEFQSRFGCERIIFLKCNVTSEEEFRGVFAKTKEKFGRIDIMVNNAGILNETNWRLTLEINLIAMIQGTMLAIEYMSKSKGGDGGIVVNMSSLAAFNTTDQHPAYCATKMGILGYTRSWAKCSTNLENGLRFCCICPDTTRTPILNFTEDSLINSKDIEEVIEDVSKQNLLSVSDVSECFIELVKDLSSNGAVIKIIIDSGQEKAYHELNSSI